VTLVPGTLSFLLLIIFYDVSFANIARVLDTQMGLAACLFLKISSSDLRDVFLFLYLFFGGIHAWELPK
jgi:prepilin signal peptidase PulO-like enzyme (type II secretory pathway)